MFSGIIMNMGTITSIKVPTNTRDLICSVKPMGNFFGEQGTSIACDGICLTLLEKTSLKGELHVNISQETYKTTTVSHWHKGKHIHLEKSLHVGDEIAGHFVTGHIDGVALLERKNRIAGSEVWHLSYPSSLFPFITAKSSITLNGVSLTVNHVTKERLTVNIIPHTLEKTCFRAMNVSEELNLEVDVFARHVVHALSAMRINDGCTK